MQPDEFLALVVPDEGLRCFVSISHGHTAQSYHTTNDRVISAAAAAVARKEDAYFAVAAYSRRVLDVEAARKAAPQDEKRLHKSRTPQHIEALQALYLDVDTQEGKPNATYADRGTAIAKAKVFCAAVGLPKPMVVDSGYGVHLYWPLEAPLTTQEWARYAAGLRAACTQYAFHADPAITTDAARILRIPGTFNFKTPTSPRPVRVLAPVEPYQITALSTLLDFAPPASPADPLASLGEKPEFTLDATTKALMGSQVASFKTLLQRSLRGSGCAQIADLVKNRATMEEPRWRAGLSIAHVCEDRDKAIKVLSEGHPGYNQEEADRKAAATAGPYTCATFRGLAPDICEGCPHKLTSPIQLARKVTVEEGEDQTVPVITTGLTALTVKLPWPYFRAATGGIWKRDNDDVDEPQKVVYPYDLYVLQRLYDQEQGQSVLLKVTLPHDGEREFTVPLGSLLVKDKFVAAMAKPGVIAARTKVDMLMDYIQKSVSALQAESKEDTLYSQFGWQENDTAFLVGERLIRQHDVTYSPPSEATRPVVPGYSAKGSLEVWKSVINVYRNKGMEHRALVFFMGFGNALLKFTPIRGYLMCMHNHKSGQGKTTVLQAIASIYGSPDDVMLTFKDTANSVMQRMGTLQNIPALMDEITNMHPHEKSDLAYALTFGRGKNRSRADINAERVNKTNWHTGMIVTANKSMAQDLRMSKALPAGELARVLDVPIFQDTTMTGLEATEHFAALKQHHGLAIVPFMQYLMTNLPAAIALYEKMYAKVQHAAKCGTAERFWVNQIALALTGGLLAQQAGLHDIDVKPIFAAGIRLIEGMRSVMADTLEMSDDVLGSFLQRYNGNKLVINKAQAAMGGGMLVAPIVEPKGALYYRFEPDTQMLYVLASAFRHECGQLQLDMDFALAPHKQSGAYRGLARRNLAAGTSYAATSSAQVLVFDTSRWSGDEEMLMAPASDDAAA